MNTHSKEQETFNENNQHAGTSIGKNNHAGGAEACIENRQINQLDELIDNFRIGDHPFYIYRSKLGLPQHQKPPYQINNLFAIVAPDECYLNILNDDCLQEIFSYFNFVERTKYEVVCHRWKNLIRQMSTRKLNFNIDPLNSLFAKEPYSNDIMFRKLMKRVGSHLRDLTVHENCFNSFKTFNKMHHHFKNIEILRLHKVSLDLKDDFHPSIFQNIKNFALTECFLEYGVAQKLFDLMKNLETLFVVNSKLNFCELIPLTHLKSLIIHTNYYTVQEDELEDILENNKQLLKLDVRLSLDTNINLNAIQTIVKCAPNLEELKLTCLMYDSFILTDSVKLVNLRKLCLNDLRYLTNNMVIDISRTCTQLEHFELIKNQQLTNEAYVSLGNLTKLSFLAICHFYIGLTSVGNETLIQLIKNLKNPGMLKHLHCSNSNISEEALYYVLTICQSLETLNINKCHFIFKATIEYAQEVVAKRNNNISLKIDVKDTLLNGIKFINEMSKNGLILTSQGCLSCQNLKKKWGF